MKILPADAALPLFGPTGHAVDPVEGIEVGDHEVFWHRRVAAGEAVIAPATEISAATGPGEKPAAAGRPDKAA